jgi:hypothetical protein
LTRAERHIEFTARTGGGAVSKHLLPARTRSTRPGIESLGY